MKNLIGYMSGALAIALLGGCVNQPEVTVRTGSGSSRIVTLGLDARDYDEVAQGLYRSIASSSKVGQNKVISLGSISLGPNVPDGLLDGVTLQEKLQTQVLRAGLFQFSMARKPRVGRDDADGNIAFQEAMEARRFYYQQTQIDNAEDDMVWGGMVPSDYLIFGRFSMQSQKNNGLKETTYRFNYKLGDCRTGLVLWTDEVQYTKSK